MPETKRGPGRPPKKPAIHTAMCVICHCLFVPPTTDAAMNVCRSPACIEMAKSIARSPMGLNTYMTKYLGSASKYRTLEVD